MVSLFGRNDNATEQWVDHRIDEKFGLISNRIDFVEFDRLVRLESNMDRVKRLETTSMLTENRISL